MTTPPHPFYAERIDPGRNMARFYALEIIEDMFGTVFIERRWGRVGTTGQRKIELLNDGLERVEHLTRLARQKQRRGYLQK